MLVSPRPPRSPSAPMRDSDPDSERATVSVVVADDHPVYRKGVIRALGEHSSIEIVGEAADGRAALALIRARTPQVALLDVRMPELDGPEVLAQLQSERLETRVVFLSAFVEGAMVHEVLTRGASGYVSKDASEEELCEAVLDAAEGSTVVSARLQGGVLDHLRNRSERAGALSGREREILTLIASGETAPSIAARLHLSEATVKTYLRRAYEKLGVSTQAAAVAEALRRGTIE
jgi:two-component system nitrate/nitrite response regulator NarL